MEIKISHTPVAYKKAMDFLEKRVEKVHANLEDELIWILEHDSVYTKGISAPDKDLLIPNLFPVIETNRGGKFTYHGPGQKIVYFVIDLNKREKEIKKFVRDVEKWIISILKDFNISSFADPKNIGIWVKNNNEENKISAIGIKIKKWIAYHGFSININVNKSDYRGIVPCGILNKGIINISDLCIIPNDEKINNSIKENFYKLFNSTLN
jgi:lipoyl(octanoyl) transferase